MPSTSAELPKIAKELNKVKTAGQAQNAIGSALRSISPLYPALKDANADEATIHRATSELTNARIWLEEWYKSIKDIPPAWDYSASWATERRHLDRAYNAIAQAEAIAEWEPRTSNWQILATSIAEAPGVFTKAVVSAATTVAAGAGNVAGSALGGIFSGLGLPLTLVVIGGVVLYLKGGNPLSLVTRLIGGKAA